MPKLDNRARFWNSFCKIWPQNQDLGLKLAADILTRRGASARTCAGTFWTVVCWYLGFWNSQKHIIFPIKKPEFVHLRFWWSGKVFELFLQNLIWESRSRAETRGRHTNSARRVHWNPFWLIFRPRFAETGVRDFWFFAAHFLNGVSYTKQEFVHLRFW